MASHSSRALVRHNCWTCHYSGPHHTDCERLTLDADVDRPILDWLEQAPVNVDGTAPADADGCPRWGGVAEPLLTERARWIRWLAGTDLADEAIGWAVAEAVGDPRPDDWRKARDIGVEAMAWAAGVLGESIRPTGRWGPRRARERPGHP